MTTLCACGCGKTTKLISRRSHDPDRGVIAGQSRKYASRQCYYTSRILDTHCKQGHRKDKPGREGKLTRCRKCDRASHRARKYGITFEFALAAPEHCEICDVHESQAPHGTLTVDHEHTTGEFRGWICLNCNVILGHAEDNIKLLKLAIRYLRRKR
jgi:recombination endonuclease VII